jgi:hypothetical protein
LFLNRNAVNIRLFGAYQLQKIIFDLSHYAKGRPAETSGGFFAWIDGKEAEKLLQKFSLKICATFTKSEKAIVPEGIPAAI